MIGIPVNHISASDIKPQSHDMIRENFCVDHWYDSLEDQIADAPDEVGTYDIAVIGTPCQPFSRQRVKRSVEGSVKAHAKYSTTFGGFTDWLQAYEPKCGCAEQVEGLGIPESTMERVTPLDRLGPFASFSWL